MGIVNHGGIQELEDKTSRKQQDQQNALRSASGAKEGRDHFPSSSPVSGWRAVQDWVQLKVKRGKGNINAKIKSAFFVKKVK